MTDATSNKKRRWVTPLLLFSLALNLLIVGAIVGFMATQRDGRQGGRELAEVRTLIGAPFVRALSADDRRQLFRGMTGQKEQIRENREALRGRVNSLIEALGSDPFDPEAVRHLLAEQRGVAVRRQEIGEALLIQRLTEMSASERREYADRLSRELRHFRRK